MHASSTTELPSWVRTMRGRIAASPEFKALAAENLYHADPTVVLALFVGKSAMLFASILGGWGAKMRAVDPPGLKLTLFPFQRQSLQWMVDRETQAGGLNALFWREHPSEHGAKFWYNPMAGELRAAPLPRFALPSWP